MIRSLSASVKKLMKSWPKFKLEPPKIPEIFERELMILSDKEKDNFLRNCWKYPPCTNKTVVGYLRILFLAKTKELSRKQKNKIAVNFLGLFYSCLT